MWLTARGALTSTRVERAQQLPHPDLQYGCRLAGAREPLRQLAIEYRRGRLILRDATAPRARLTRVGNFYSINVPERPLNALGSFSNAEGSGAGLQWRATT